MQLDGFHTVQGLLVCSLGLVSPVFSPVFADAPPPDPLDSPQWGVMHERFLNQGKVVFDGKVEVLAPASAEDSLNVPVSFKAGALGQVDEVVVIADLNPLPMVLKFRPKGVSPNLSFRMKLQQRTPVRVAARTPDGVWHVSAVVVDAAGGGCTLPSVGVSKGSWVQTLGHVTANVWERPDGNNRLRVRVMHPMDTGLASGVPKFHIEQLDIKEAASQQVMAELELFEPVSENPMLSLDVGKHTEFALGGRDNNGNQIHAVIKP